MMRGRPLVWLGLIAACGAATMSGCKPKLQPAAPITSVGQGELFETGQPVYDEYFSTVHELHAAVATGELEERDARTTLATMLQLLPTAPTTQIVRKLRERANELPRMQLKIEKDDKDEKRQTAKVVLLDSGRPEEATKNMLMVLEATVNATFDLARRMAEIPERSRRMHALCKALIDGSEKELSDQTPEQRQRVRLELEASLDVLVLVANASRDVEARARQFVANLQAALREAEDNEPSSEAPKAQRSGASAPAAKPEPKMPDDFNP